MKHNNSLDLSECRAITSRYRDIESELQVNVYNSEISYVSPVNFVESSVSPRHRWFPYKEGFSPSFVRSVLEDAKLKSEEIVLDPFSGVGSTCIAAADMGYRSIGIEISPLANFIARTKSISQDQLNSQRISRLTKALKIPRSRKPTDPPENETVQRYFYPEVLQVILEIKQLVAETPGDEAMLLKLALLANLETFSTHRRAGNGVKRKSKQPPELSLGEARRWISQTLLEAVSMMLKDIETKPLARSPKFLTGSSLSKNVMTDVPPIGCVVTSPPYPNCFDYSKIYQRELWIGDFLENVDGLKLFRNESVQSHVHSTWSRVNSSLGSRTVEEFVVPYLNTKKMWSSKIPQMLSGYFKDLGDCLLGLAPKLPIGGICNFVVGNAHYSGIPVPTDLLLAELAPECGYSVERIDVYRRIVPSAQYIRTGADLTWARESNVVLRRI